MLDNGFRTNEQTRDVNPGNQSRCIFESQIEKKTCDVSNCVKVECSVKNHNPDMHKICS